MIKLLIVIAVILGIIAINTFGKLSDLLGDIKQKTPGEVTDSDNKMNAYGFLAFLFIFFGLIVWQIFAWKDYMLPDPASIHGVKTDQLLNVTWWIIAVPFVGCQLLLFIFCYKYAYNKNRTATFFAHSNKLELFWTAIPSIVLLILVSYGLMTWNEVMTPPAEEEETVKIELYGKQFQWFARYAGENNEFGRADVRLIEGTNGLGLDSLDPRGWDDKIVFSEFHIPKGKTIEFQFRSQDIIHSAYMPHFRAQMNCVPGMVTNFSFTPTKTTEEMRKDPYVIQKMENINRLRTARDADSIEFDYVLLCNKICGTSHYDMKMKIVVDTEEDYKKWLAKKKPFAPHRL